MVEIIRCSTHADIGTNKLFQCFDRVINPAQQYGLAKKRDVGTMQIQTGFLAAPENSLA